MNIDTVSRRAFLVAAVLSIVYGGAWGQVTQIRPLDLLPAIQAGTMHLSIAPTGAGDSTKIFDGNPFSDLFYYPCDTLRVTLQSDTAVQIQGTKVRFLTTGKWSLETANSMADLNAKTGSYSLLVDRRTYPSSGWDSVAFTQTTVSVIRLTAIDTAVHFIDIGEWVLQNTVTFTGLVILPYPPKVIPGQSLKAHVNMLDDKGAVYPYTLSYPIEWSIDDQATATVDVNGWIKGVQAGSTVVHASTAPSVLTGKAPVIVETDFVSKKVAPIDVRVALVLIDPPLPDYGYERMHVKYGWRDPVVLTNALVKYWREATDSVVNFRIDTTIDAGRLFTRMWGSFPTVMQFEAYLNEPGWKTLKGASDSGNLYFDYTYFANYYHLDTLRNQGRIDEVWVYAAPYMGMYESQLMGPTAFWWNSPPIKGGTGLRRLLSVMGLNYERGVDLAFHSFGHRLESAMIQTYIDAWGQGWNQYPSHPTPWDIFTRLNKDNPGNAHVGNTHFPPNGAHDYDYGNTTIVTSYAQNWFRYPYLFQETAQVNVSTWLYPKAEPLAEGLDQLGYLSWMYNHVPRYEGVSDGVLNNWWPYFLDYDAAVTEAKGMPVLSVNPGGDGRVPDHFRLDQNYPNPFNPTTVVSFQLSVASDVRLVVYDILGREVKVLVNEKRAPGTYEVKFDGSGLSSGVYFYRLTAPGEFLTRKMLLLK
jgi:hypothetical protein